MPPWVTSRDGRFVTSAGRPITLHGVNVQVTNPAVYQEALRLNVNFVRVVASKGRTGLLAWLDARMAGTPAPAGCAS